MCTYVHTCIYIYIYELLFMYLALSIYSYNADDYDNQRRGLLIDRFDKFQTSNVILTVECLRMIKMKIIT